MIFTNTRAQISYTGNYIQSTAKSNSRIIPFSLIRPKKIPEQIVPKVSVNASNTEVTVKKMKWGEPIWNLFHVLAEKVKEETFSTIREELLNVIYTICSNLPCPDCTNHATIYMNGINYKSIQTKEQLKELLYTFHNSVNIRKGYALFPRDQLSSKYYYMETIPTIYTFMIHFKDKHKSVRMIANDFHRSRTAENLKVWFNKHIQYFDL
jgi:hypothetical protein